MFIKYSLCSPQKHTLLFASKRMVFLEGEPSALDSKETLKPIDVFYFIDTYIDPEKKDRVNIQKAKDVVKTLDPETKKRLHFLTPPIFSYTDAGQPQQYPEGYRVRINITDPPEKIKKALEYAASRVLEPRFLSNAPKENNAARTAMAKGIPFKNVRQAYFDDQNSANKKINWNDQNGKPFPPYAYVEPSQEIWFNCAVEMPAETTARLQKLERERAAKLQAEQQAQKEAEEKLLAEQRESQKATEDAIENEEASEQETKDLDNAIANLRAKEKEIGDAYGIKLIANDEYEKPYKSKEIEGEATRLNNLTTALDKFKTVFEGLNKGTQNILKLLTLVIDRETSADPTVEGRNGDYNLWFNILNSEEKIKRDLINRKNDFVKSSSFKKDTPAEKTERATAKAKGQTFKNCREAYNSRPKEIEYDSASEKWVPSAGRNWVAPDATYNYATVSTATPEPPAPAPKPPPTRREETPPSPPRREPSPEPPRREPAPERPAEDSKYVAAPTDTIIYNDGKIITKQMREGKNRLNEFTLTTEDAMPISINVRIDYEPYGNVKCLRLYADTERKYPVVDIFLDKDGVIREKHVSPYYVIINGTTVAVKKKKRITG